MIKVVIADDHAIVRQGLKQLLLMQHNMAVVGEAANHVEVMHALRHHDVDTLLLDIAMPGRNGIDTLKQLRPEFPKLPAATPDVAARLNELTGGDGPTAVFDATGNAASMAAAFNYVAPGGRLVFVGLFMGDVRLNDPHFHRRELTLLASRNSRPEDFRRIITLIESGRIDTTPWITHRASLLDVPAQFAGWTDPAAGVLKAMISL